MMPRLVRVVHSLVSKPRPLWIATFLAASCTVQLTSKPAAAQSHPAAAEALFQEGIEAGKQERYQDAIQKFQASYALEPARGTLQALALAEERARLLATAQAHLRDLLALARKAGDTARVDYALQKLEAIGPRVPTLTLTATASLPPQARIVLDSAVVPVEVVGTPIPLDPGRHELRVTAPAHRDVSTTLDLAEGASVSFAVTLEPAGPPVAGKAASAPDSASRAPRIPPAAASPRDTATAATWPRTAGFVGAGVGLLAIGAGTWLWTRSGDEYDDLRSACPDYRCPTDLSDRVDEGRTLQTWANVAWAGGGALLVGGVGMVLFASPSSDRAAAGPKTVFVAPGSVHLRGAF